MARPNFGRKIQIVRQRLFLAFGYGQIPMNLQRDKFLKKASFKIEELCKLTMMNFKIEQRDAVAPLLDVGTDVISVTDEI